LNKFIKFVSFWLSLIYCVLVGKNLEIFQNKFFLSKI
jgi:hypothetical protein